MDLLPFTNYQVQLRATNVFSFAVNADDLLLGTDVVTMTTEGGMYATHGAGYIIY